MTDRPIIFSAPMIRALLDGRKSMTRRILKPQPPEWVTRMCHEGRNGWIGSGDGHGTLMHVPYAVGDRLWVREAWRIGAWDFEDSTMCVDFRADGFADTTRRHVHDSDWFENAWIGVSDELHAKGIQTDAEGNYHWDAGNGPLRWRSPIHMPRWASRLTLTVTDVRLQRLQDISEADAVAEGIEPGRRLSCGGMSHTAVDIFCDLWNSIHGPEAWALNPWCAVLSFTVHRCNIDNLPGGDHVSV